MRKKSELFLKAERVIKSCKKQSQFDTCVKYLTLLATLQPQDNIEALMDKIVDKIPLPSALGEGPLYEPEKKKNKLFNLPTIISHYFLR